MGEKDIFFEVNRKLEDVGYRIRIRSLAELRDFVNNKGNCEMPVYDDILELYDQIRLGIGMW
ncbi:MAG: hypothetical protein GX660_17310 [Clostridiaceae bacterium]|nr:hypothetical protein [Clostridiaceae bacterium]